MFCLSTKNADVRGHRHFWLVFTDKIIQAKALFEATAILKILVWVLSYVDEGRYFYLILKKSRLNNLLTY